MDDHQATTNRAALRRNVRAQNHCESESGLDPISSVYHQYATGTGSTMNDISELIQLVELQHSSADGTRGGKRNQQFRFENTIEAKVEPGDTLQALALRYHCPVAVIKRLNKIDKDNEIHARSIIKIPVTVHNVLLGPTSANIQPTVHKSGNNSPKQDASIEGSSAFDVQVPLANTSKVLQEKLLVASVNASGGSSSDTDINQIIMDSKITAVAPTDSANINSYDFDAQLIDDCMVNVRPIPGPGGLSLLDWPGADCGMTWICLFLVIIMICVIIPLIYVIYLAEHPPHHHD